MRSEAFDGMMYVMRRPQHDPKIPENTETAFLVLLCRASIATGGVVLTVRRGNVQLEQIIPVTRAGLLQVILTLCGGGVRAGPRCGGGNGVSCII